MKFWQRKLIVNKHFQYKMVGYLVFVSILIGTFFIAINALIFRAFNKQFAGINNFYVAEEFLQGIEFITMITYLIVMGLLIVLFAILGLYLSNQVAGPIWRIERHIKERLNGEHNKKLQFRKHDFFPELAEQINVLLPGKEEDPSKSDL